MAITNYTPEFLLRYQAELLEQLVTNGVGSSGSASDYTLGSAILTITSAVQSMPAVPTGTKRVVFNVLSGEIIYATDPANPPTETPLRGFRMGDGQTQVVYQPDFAGFKIRRKGSVDAQIYIEYKGSV